MNPTFRDFLKLHFLVLIFGFTAILGALISTHPISVVFFRTSLATIGMLVWSYFGKFSLKANTATIVKLLLTGIIINIHWFLFFQSSRLSNIAICLAGFSTASLWTSLIEPIATKRKVSVIEITFGIIAILGLGVVFFSVTDKIWGLIFGVLSGLMGAIFTVINGQFTQKHDSKIITFYEMMGAGLSAIIIFPIYQYFEFDSIDFIPKGLDWLWLGLLSFVCTVYAFSALTGLLVKFSAFTVNLTINLEPLYGIILAFIIFGEKEKMNPNFYIGTAIIVGSVLLFPIMKKAVSSEQ
jgi:drug/metabolite transporter (DMT)-like permease